MDNIRALHSSMYVVLHTNIVHIYTVITTPWLQLVIKLVYAVSASNQAKFMIFGKTLDQR